MKATLPPGSGSIKTITRSNALTSVSVIPSKTFHASPIGSPAAVADLSSLTGSNTIATQKGAATNFVSAGVTRGGSADAKVAPSRRAIIAPIILTVLPPQAYFVSLGDLIPDLTGSVAF